VQFNYPLHLSVAWLLIIGGIGFPIVFNVAKYVKYQFKRLISFGRWKSGYIPWVLNLNSRIVLITTGILIVLGTVLIFIFEYDHTLKDHPTLFGKIVTAFFAAVTPRTAGFNTVNMTALAFPTIMITFLLMWIGASPGSTGGGIKTSAFAIGTLNFFSLARGKTRIEIFRREIADISVRRAFATICLSLVVIGFAVFCLSVTDPEKNLIGLAFEVFSAFSTVGLTLNLTMSLSPLGKLIIVTVMFVGRVSMLTIMMAVFKQERYKKYRYPTEEVLLN
jgi:Trk-type K+ transport system membrane component